MNHKYSQTLEVRNITTWTGQVLDDARGKGFTLQKPYYFALTNWIDSFYVHGLTDADFMCMDVADNSEVAPKNLYIPKIGKYSIGLSLNGSENSINTQEAIDYTWNVQNQAYPQSEITDSIGRTWIKVNITEYSGDRTRKVTYKSQTLPIYYCVENDLGKVFIDRTW